MPLINRYSGIIQGSMILTGNTLAIRQATPFPPATYDWQNGSYISTNTSLVAAAGFPTGTTFLASQASSTAILNLPTNSTVVFAQLYWTWNGPANNTNVTLTTPIGTNTISPNTALNQTIPTNPSIPLQWRAQDVTSIINASGSGLYTFSPAPGPDAVNNSSAQGTAWYLIVVYKNQSLPFRFFNVNTGASAVTQSAPSDFTFSNLVTPSSGPANGYLLVSAHWGDLVDGARILVGPVLASAVQIGNSSTGTWNGVAPYAQINNMLPGNILIADCNDNQIGLLDTRGSFGTYNKNPFNTTAPPFARTNTDILGISISSTLTNNQTSLFTRVTYGGSGTGEILSQSVQVDVNAASLTPMVKTVDKNFSDLGETLTYEIAFKNSGLVPANNVVFMDTIPSGTTFITGSVIIDNVSQPTANPALPGIPLGTIASNQSVTVSFKVTVSSTIPSPNPLPNRCSLTYSFIPAIGQPTQYSDNQSNTVYTQINTATIASSKTVNKSYANVGDVLTYTIPITVYGSTSATNVVLLDTLPSDLSIVVNSLTVNGTPVAGSTNPPSGLSLGSLPANAITTVSYKILITTIPSPNPILDSANISCNYTVDPSIPTIKSLSTNTNIVSTQVNNANLGNITKYVDKGYATCGDTLTYTIVIPNSGNITAQNIVFRDTIPSGTAFVTDSVYINGSQSLGANPSTGITLPNIAPGTATTLTFKVVVQC